jgi:hypothetical protein
MRLRHRRADVTDADVAAAQTRGIGVIDST